SAPPPPPPPGGPVSMTVAYNGTLRDRVGQGNTALAADGALDATLTATLTGAAGRAVTRVRLQSGGQGLWDTDSGTIDWALGVAGTLDGPLLNNPTTMAVNFSVADGGTFSIFASEYPPMPQFVGGATLTLTATLADGTTATASTTVPASQAPTLSSMSPTSVAAGSGAFTLTVNGTNFVAGATVQWNGAARAT